MRNLSPVLRVNAPLSFITRLRISSRQRFGSRRSMPMKYWSYRARSASSSSSVDCTSLSSSSFSRLDLERESSLAGADPFTSEERGGGLGESATSGSVSAGAAADQTPLGG